MVKLLIDKAEYLGFKVGWTAKSRDVGLRLFYSGAIQRNSGVVELLPWNSLFADEVSATLIFCR